MHYYMYDVNVSDSGICSAMQTSLIAGHAGTITGILGEIHSFIAFTYVHSKTSVTWDCRTGTVTVHQSRNNQLHILVNGAFAVQASVSISAEQSEFMSAFEAVTPPPGTSDLTAKVSESLSARTMSALVHKTRVEVS